VFNRCLLIFACIFFLSACANKEVPTQTSSLQSANVLFFDSSLFDSELHKKLKQVPSEVIIDFPSQFDLNKLPSRMEKWLAAINEQGGNTELIKTPESSVTRGFLMDAVELTMKVYESLTESDAIYKSAEGYSTQIFYNEAGMVERIILGKR